MSHFTHVQGTVTIISCHALKRELSRCDNPVIRSTANLLLSSSLQSRLKVAFFFLCGSGGRQGYRGPAHSQGFIQETHVLGGNE